MSHRWSLVANFLYTWTFSHSLDQTPNGPLNNPTDTTLWTVKLFGTYQAPWGIVVSPLLRHQAGANLSRTIASVVTTNSSSSSFTVDRTGTYRQDNVTIFDTRFEKRLRFPRRREVGLFFDAFNILNSNAAQNQDNQTGRRTVTLPTGEVVDYPRFMRPTTLIGPRVFKVGLKLAF